MEQLIQGLGIDPADGLLPADLDARANAVVALRARARARAVRFIIRVPFGCGVRKRSLKSGDRACEETAPRPYFLPSAGADGFGGGSSSMSGAEKARLTSTAA